MDKQSLKDLVERTRASRTPDDYKVSTMVAPIFQHMLGDGMSVIDPSVKIWTAEVAEDLRQRIEDNPRTSDQDQWTKLALQLAGAPRATVLLAAEIVFLREQPLLNAQASTRRAHITTTLSVLENPPQLPELFEQCLAVSGQAGFAPGQGYYTNAYKDIVWVAKFVRDYWQWRTANPTAPQPDAWDLQDIMLAVQPADHSMRNALQVLMAPDVFEVISSPRSKRTIVEAFARRFGETFDTNDFKAIDEALLRIRARVAKEHPSPFHWWHAEIYRMWQPSPVPDPPSPEPAPKCRYWVYTPGRNASRWEEFSKHDVIALDFGDYGDLSDATTRREIRQRALDRAEPLGPIDAKALFDFHHTMKPGDVVYAKKGTRTLLGRGVVTSEAYYDADVDDFRYRRHITWDFQEQVDVTGKVKFASKTLTEITRDAETRSTLDDIIGTEPPEPPVVPAPENPYTRQNFLDDVFVDEQFYDRLTRLLERKKNLLLAGPPGVGKTYAAKRLAWAMMGIRDSERISMVQFHQSYSYEDFVMGYRPEESGGFIRKEGPFLTFCEKAAEDPDNPYFFLIDEINRSNISKIFGELLLLIEADKRGSTTIRLMYQDKEFSIPPNLYIIGMMNTADRSLAVLDYALRRRFGHVTMRPGFDSRGFAEFLDTVDSPEMNALVREVEQLNNEIANDPGLGAGYLIGHSFFTGVAAASIEDDLSSIVEDELIPLLQEYWFDNPTMVQLWAQRLRDCLG